MKHPILLICGFLLCMRADAQYLEVGGYVGGANYIGELSGQRMVNNGWNGMFGLFGRLNATTRLSLKGSITKATLSGSDKFAKTEAARMRNLSFRSELLELGITGEYNLSDFNIRDKKTSVPYVFSGVAITHFNPEAQMRGIWYDLQPLQTEGRQYKRLAIAIPVGIGIKFNISYKLNIGLEAGVRRTFTDYLDDVSTYYPDLAALRSSEPVAASLSYRSPEITGEFSENPMGTVRGDSKNKDLYFFSGLTVSVNLTDKYGLDFDKKYEVFKTRPFFKTPEADQAQNGQVEKQKRKKQKNSPIRRLFKKKQYLEPQVKKRSSPKQ